MEQVCKYCKVNTKLIKAHIVPQSFLGNVNDLRFKEVSTEVSYPKKRPIGPYDEEILCAECDNKIGVYDGYAKQLLIDNLPKYKHPTNPFYLIPHTEFDFCKLKKFFISLIWRASISEHEMYNRVSLGVYNDIALSSLKNEIDIRDDIFAVLIFKDGANIKYQNVISFISTKLAKKTAYKIHFSGYQIIIVPKAKDMKWDIKDRSTSPESYFLKNGSDLIIFETTTDLSGKDLMIQKVYTKLRQNKSL